MVKTKEQLKIVHIIILIALIAIAVFRCIYIFTVQKEGFHSDEPWSYGFANSSVGGFNYIEIKEGESFLKADTLKNYNEWVSGEEFRNYLTVSEDKRFDFSNVISNKAPDMSPPLFELILHFISSFFPGRFSWWFAFSINLFCAVAILVVLFCLAYELSGKVYFSLIITGFFGMSTMFRASIIFLRMYALLTLFGLILALLNTIAYKREYKKSIHLYILMAVTTFLGAFTQYIFLAYAFAITAVMTIFLMVKKKWKAVAGYAGAMLASVILFFILSPYDAFGMSFGTSGMVESMTTDPFIIKELAVVNSLTLELFGVPWFADVAGVKKALFWVAIIIVLIALVIALVRKEAFFKPVADKLEAKKELLKKAPRSFWTEIGKSINWMAVALFVAFIGCVHFISRFTSVIAMGDKVDRYVFNIAPILVLIVGLIIYSMLSLVFKHRNKAVITVMLIVAIAFSAFREWNFSGMTPYTYNQGEDKTDFSELVADNDVIIVTGSASRLEWYSGLLYKCNSFYATGTWDISDNQATYDEPAGAEKLYLFVEKDNFLIAEYLNDPEYINYVLNGNITNIALCTINEYLGMFIDNNDWVDSISFVHNFNSFCGEIYVFEVETR